MGFNYVDNLSVPFLPQMVIGKSHVYCNEYRYAIYSRSFETFHIDNLPTATISPLIFEMLNVIFLTVAVMVAVG
ncbi:hypothetical protein GFK82_00761 [Candidatus Steffania adelgidicola]|nr:hypothetical protein GFK82_00761 [Candidatus Steffania adelgidicola]